MKDFEKQIDAYLVEQQERTERKQALRAEHEAVEKTNPVRALAISGELEQLRLEDHAASQAVAGAFRAKAEAELEAMKPAFAEVYADMERVRAELCAAIDRWPCMIAELRALVARQTELVAEANGHANALGTGHRSPTTFKYEIQSVERHIRARTNQGTHLVVPSQ